MIIQKIVSKIGQNYPIPIEITPIAYKITKSLIGKIAKSCVMRENLEKNAFAITSYGNFVLDCDFSYDDLKVLEKKFQIRLGFLSMGYFRNI